MSRTGQALSIWVITTARRGDRVQCEAVARALSDDIRFIEVMPRQPWAFFMPFGPVDPNERSLFNPPFPDLIIAANRRAYPYAKYVHNQSRGNTKIVFLKPPGRDVASFAKLWAPAHNHINGEHVISTLTAPHLVSAQQLEWCRQHPIAEIAALRRPRLGVVLGGNTKRVTYDASAIHAVTEKIKAAHGFHSLMVTPSRRTPPALLAALCQANPFEQSFVWEGEGANPYFHLLALADALLVTGDSHNMVGEALAAGVAVHVVEPAANPSKFSWTIAELRNRGLIKPMTTPIAPEAQPAFNETPEIAMRIREILSL